MIEILYYMDLVLIVIFRQPHYGNRHTVILILCSMKEKICHFCFEKCIKNCIFLLGEL